MKINQIAKKENFQIFLFFSSKLVSPLETQTKDLNRLESLKFPTFHRFLFQFQSELSRFLITHHNFVSCLDSMNFQLHSLILTYGKRKCGRFNRKKSTEWATTSSSSSKWECENDYCLMWQNYLYDEQHRSGSVASETILKYFRVLFHSYQPSYSFLRNPLQFPSSKVNIQCLEFFLPNSMQQSRRVNVNSMEGKRESQWILIFFIFHLTWLD